MHEAVVVMTTMERLDGTDVPFTKVYRLEFDSEQQMMDWLRAGETPYEVQQLKS